MSKETDGITEDDYRKLIAGSQLILATVAVTLALKYTSILLIPFTLSLFLFYLISPLIRFLMCACRFPRWLAIVVSFFVIGSGIAIIIPFIASSISTFVAGIGLYQDRVISMTESVLNWLGKYHLNVGQEVVLEAVQSFPFLQWAQSFIGNATSIVANIFLVLIFLIFLIIGKKTEERTKSELFEKIEMNIHRYLMTKLITSATTGILVGLILYAIGVQLAVVFGVLAFLLNFIPNVGSIISTLLPIPIAFLQFSSPIPILASIFLPMAVQMAVGNVIEPMIMGQRLDLHPVTILLALIFWGLIWGIPGMLLAAPITAVIRIVCERFEITKPIAELLSGRLSF